MSFSTYGARTYFNYPKFEIGYTKINGLSLFKKILSSEHKFELRANKLKKLSENTPRINDYVRLSNCNVLSVSPNTISFSPISPVADIENRSLSI